MKKDIMAPNSMELKLSKILGKYDKLNPRVNLTYDSFNALRRISISTYYEKYIQDRFSALEAKLIIQESDSANIKIFNAFVDQLNKNFNLYKKMEIEVEILLSEIAKVIPDPIDPDFIETYCGALNRLNDYVDMLKPKLERIKQLKEQRDEIFKKIRNFWN